MQSIRPLTSRKSAKKLILKNQMYRTINSSSSRLKSALQIIAIADIIEF